MKYYLPLLLATALISQTSLAGIPTKSGNPHDSVSSASGAHKVKSHISDDPKKRAQIVAALCKNVSRNQHSRFFALLAEQQLRLERIYQEINCGELHGESLIHVVLNKVTKTYPTGEKIINYFKLLKEKHPDADIAAIFNTQYSKGTILDSVLSRQKYLGDGAPEKIKTGLKNLEQLLHDVGAETR
ncbi:MAG: hypothetical protein COC05_05345 [Gammaproteobacteria bacterium]|nr:MAG: hypothetical protein COC05_05345 [Gammaproteobacteria bacterium]